MSFDKLINSQPSILEFKEKKMIITCFIVGLDKLDSMSQQINK